MNDRDLLQEIRDDVRAVRSELTGVLVQVASLGEWRKATEKSEMERAHEVRIRRLEESWAKLLGASAAVATLASLIVGLVLRLVGK